MSKRLCILVGILILAGCSAPPAPNPDGPVLLGFDSMPKALATVFLSPTPDAPQAQATYNSLFPTNTAAPATRTPTATPFVGIFMGDRTALPGTVAYQPTANRNPLVVTVVGTRGPTVRPGQSAPTAISAASTPLSAASCAIQPAPQFARASATPAVQQRLGCPNAPPFNLNLVTQLFQNGVMFWRDTKEIYALSTANTFWKFPDSWNEGMPANDPSLAPPPGTQQPVRGFGFVWRSNAVVRDTLGWAISGEQPYQATWQAFDRGWMMTGINGVIYALSPNDNATGVHFGALSQ